MSEPSEKSSTAAARTDGLIVGGAKYFCTFCGKPSTDAALLVAAPGKTAFICEGCIVGCFQVLTGKAREVANTLPLRTEAP